VTAIALATDLIAGRWSDHLLTRLIVDLGDPGRAGSVRERLARAVGDPSLVVAYAIDGATRTFVDEAGIPVEEPRATPRQVVVPLTFEDREVGVVAGDAVVFDDPLLRGAVATAAGLATANAWMQAQILERVYEVEASRARLVGAADTQRRRTEARIQAGAASRLGRVAEVLATAQQQRPDDEALRALREDLEAARRELDGFALGVHPAILSSAGLAAAMHELARRTRLRVAVAATARRADPLTESTLYFVCAEAIANAAKYAHATTIRIELLDRGPRLRLQIVDDGVGGATVGARGGLRGLIDRVEALGGSLTVESPAGRGTRLLAEMPWRAGGSSLARFGNADPTAT
jgi:signal transduction histidine kinase